MVPTVQFSKKTFCWHQNTVLYIKHISTTFCDKVTNSCPPKLLEKKPIFTSPWYTLLKLLHNLDFNCPIVVIEFSQYCIKNVQMKKISLWCVLLKSHLFIHLWIWYQTTNNGLFFVVWIFCSNQKQEMQKRVTVRTWFWYLISRVNHSRIGLDTMAALEPYANLIKELFDTG